jgi:hypothetical protein
MAPSLEALLTVLVRGDFCEIEDGIYEAGREEAEFDPFAEGEEDDGACIAPSSHSY